MSLFDLLFILVFFGTVATTLWILILAIRGHWVSALGRLFALVGFLAAYVSIVVVVSLLSPRKEFQLGQDQCFDDWCMGVESVRFSHTVGSGSARAEARGIFCLLSLRVSSRARGRTQAAPDAAAYLLDDRGRIYQPSAEGQRAYESSYGSSIPLGSRVAPGASFRSILVLDMPRDAAGIGLVVVHGGWPGRFIIGDSNSLLHKKTVILLPRPPE